MTDSRRTALTLCALLALLAGMPRHPGAQSRFLSRGFIRTPDGAITLFDGPDAVQTWSLDINSAGTVTGNFAKDGNDDPRSHGFVRDADGTWTTFDVPDIDCETYPAAINDAGLVVGNCDGSEATYGFARAPNGAITTFLGPKGESVRVAGLNAAGTIAGEFQTANGTHYGYLRDASGLMTLFPLSLVGADISGLTATGEVWGDYGTELLQTHGFVRSVDGTIRTFDAPGAPQRTYLNAVNAAGEMLGSYTEAKTSYAFVEGEHGRTRIDEPDGAHLIPMHLNSSGMVTGGYEVKRPSSRSQAFVRAADGTLTLFEIPGSTETIPRRINDAGVVVGDYRTR